MNKNDYCNSSLNEYSIKAKIIEKIATITQKNKFIKLKLADNQTEINETQIINNLNDVSALLSQVSSLLSQLKDIINGKTEEDEKLQLIYRFQMKQYKKEQSDFIANQGAFDSFVSSSLQFINPKEEEMEEEENITHQSTEDDAKFALHTSNTQSQINDIYEKTIAINQISRDINMLSRSQESKIETIENNFHTMKSNTHKGNQEIMNKCKEKSVKSQTNVYSTLFIFLLCVFVVLLYSQLFKK